MLFPCCGRRRWTRPRNCPNVFDKMGSAVVVTGRGQRNEDGACRLRVAARGLAATGVGPRTVAVVDLEIAAQAGRAQEAQPRAPAEGRAPRPSIRSRSPRPTSPEARAGEPEPGTSPIRRLPQRAPGTPPPSGADAAAGQGARAPGSGASCARPGPSATRRASRSSCSASARAAAAPCTPASPAPHPIRSIAPPTRRACTSMPTAPTCPTCCAPTMPGRTGCRSPTRRPSRRSGYSKDIRYTARGNVIASRRDLVEAGHRCAPRHPADRRHHLLGALPLSARATPGKLLPDHYPVKIARDSIKPGTIIYDPNGHVAVVYKVTPEGRIHYIDTHPDNSLTRGVYGKAFTRSSPAMGAGFKRWRPLTLVGATQRPDGSYARRPDQARADKDIADWSDEQFFGTEAERPKAVERRQVRARGRDARILRLRAQAARQRRLQVRPAGGDALDGALAVRGPEVPRRRGGRRHQGRHPQAAAARPAAQQHLRHRRRLGDLLHALARRTPEDRLQGAARRGRALPDAGGCGQRPAGLRGRATSAAISARPICRRRAPAPSPTRASDGSEKQLAFAEVARRLFALSFDPHHCAERRWGAQDAEELATCADGADKRAWYEAEQRLRNQPDRTYDVRMGFSLADLRAARCRQRHRSAARSSTCWRCSRATRQPRRSAACSRHAEAPAQRIAGVTGLCRCPMGPAASGLDASAQPASAQAAMPAWSPAESARSASARDRARAKPIAWVPTRTRQSHLLAARLRAWRPEWDPIPRDAGSGPAGCRLPSPRAVPERAQTAKQQPVRRAAPAAFGACARTG